MSSPISSQSPGSQASQHSLTSNTKDLTPNAGTINALYEKAKYDPRMCTEDDWKHLYNEWSALTKSLQPEDWEGIKVDFPKEQWPKEVEKNNVVELGRYEREMREMGEPPLWKGEAKREDTDNPVENAAH